MDRVEILRDWYEIFEFRSVAEGGLDEWFARHSLPGFVVIIPDAYPDTSELRGAGGVRAFFRMLAEAWEDWTFDPEEFIECGDVVLVKVRLCARGRESGVSLDRRTAHVWRFDGDQAESMQVFLDRAEAMETAGLESGP
jgi:ketosteroid isomerase-like protein